MSAQTNRGDSTYTLMTDASSLTSYHNQEAQRATWTINNKQCVVHDTGDTIRTNLETSPQGYWLAVGDPAVQ